MGVRGHLDLGWHRYTVDMRIKPRTISFGSLITIQMLSKRHRREEDNFTLFNNITDQTKIITLASLAVCLFGRLFGRVSRNIPFPSVSNSETHNININLDRVFKS